MRSQLDLSSHRSDHGLYFRGKILEKIIDDLGCTSMKSMDRSKHYRAF